MKKLIWAIFTMAIFSGGTAFADLVDATISGDDNVSYWNGSNWIAEGTAWPTSESFSVNITAPSDIVYFAVSNNNWYPGGDPAAFIGTFQDTSGGVFSQTGTSTLLTNTSTFQVLAVPPFNSNLPGPVPLSEINPSYPPPTSGYITPTSFGTNAGPSIWTSANGGPISGIDPDAEWLWTANNDGTYATQDDYAFFAVNLGDSSTVPEPSTLWLFAFASVLFFLFNRRKFFRIV